MSQREDLIASLENSHARMKSLLNEIDLNREIYPLWTVREMLAHLAGWDEAVIGYIRSLLAGEIPATPAIRGIDVYNAESIAARAGLDYDQLQWEYIENRGLLLELLEKIPEEEITARHIVPWGSPGNLVEIVNIWRSHELEHVEDMKRIIAHGQERS